MLGQHKQLVRRNLPKVSTLAGNRTQHPLFARQVGYPLHHRATQTVCAICDVYEGRERWRP